MKSTKHALLVTIWAVFQAGKKNYTTVSIDRLIVLLHDFHDVNIKRRWLFYCLHDLLEAGLIARKTRFKQGDQLEIHQLPSMLTFTLKGLRFLVRNKVSGAYAALKAMIAWLKESDTRFPHNEDMLPDLSLSERNDNIKRLKELFNRVGRHGT